MRLAGVGLLLAGCSAPSPCGPSTATVSRVVDGDTIELDTGDRVRYLLVDAPETTQGHNDCYGAQAVEYNRMQVEGKQVSLTYDAESCKDRYGRWLAYVSVDGHEVNRGLMENGLACVLYISPGGMARKQEFEDYEVVAKTNRVGLWGACNPVTCE
ncbi:MAG: thermonuclease family protein [Archangiaceae bacterium]|nr:thermonuclease family protein [Archangiaceae bacterium]